MPVELKDDYTGRLKDETVFVFPFDHPARGAEEAYEDIADKLRSLVYPILFLNHLNRFGFILHFNIYDINSRNQFRKVDL